MLIRPLNLVLSGNHFEVSTPEDPGLLAVLRTRGPKRGDPPCGSGGKNLGQGLGFCNFLPGKLPHTGTFYISSVRPPIVIGLYYGQCSEAEPIWGSPPDFSRRFIPTP